MTVGTCSGTGEPLPTVSVVMPTYNRRDLMLRSVQAILADPSTTEVVVVVDGATDGSLGALEAMAAHEPRLRPLGVDRGGQARATQLGIERASGEVVLQLDDDVVAGPGLAAGHARHHRDREGLLVLGYMPPLVPRGGSPDYVATRVYASDYEQCCQGWRDDPSRILRSLWAGNLSMRREDFLRVGYASPEFTRDQHDLDFGIRCLRAGLSAVFDPALHAEHEHIRTFDAFLELSRQQAIETWRMHEHHGDVLGPFVDEVDARLPRPARWAVRAARHPRVARAETAVLRALVRLPAPVAQRWQTQVAALARSVQQAAIRATLRRA